MSTTPQPISQPRPVHGTCRWISRRYRVVQINHVRYTIIRHANCYRLLNWDNGNTYSVEAKGRWCTCLSYVWDHCPIQAGGDGRCKHIAALQSLALLPEPSQPACPEPVQDLQAV